MSTPSPVPGPAPRPWPWLLLPATLLLAALATALATVLLDQWGWQALMWRSDTPERFDWYKAVRVLGYFPVWLVVGLALILIDSARTTDGELTGKPATWTRGPFLIVSAGLAGLLADGLKLVLRRQRPIDTQGEHVFLSFAQHTWDSSYFGLPSSHAAVAFGAAFALAKLHPRAAPVFLLAACACGLSRVQVGQHFISDVVLAAGVGLLIPLLLTLIHQRLAR